MRLDARPVRYAVWRVGLVPLALLARDFAYDGLGPEPVEAITHRTGTWALRMLLLSLAVTPVRRLIGRGDIVPHRRTLGLLAFFYAALHLAAWVVFEVELDPARVVESIVEHPFVTVGAAAFLALVPLALTSNRAAIRRLGARWRSLHRLAYVAAVLAAVHFAWAVKSDLRWPLVYAGATAALLGVRLYWLAPGTGRKRGRYAKLSRSSEPDGPPEPSRGTG